MLPFLKPRKQSDGIATVYRAPDEGKPEDSSSDGLEIAMEDLSKAHDAKDYKAMAEAFKAAFDICEAAPHHEGPHLEDSEE